MALSWQWNPYAPIPGACVLLAGVIAVITYRRHRRVRALHEFTVVAGLMAAFCLGETLELCSATLGQKQWGVTLFYVTFPFIPITALRFALAFAGKEEWLSRRRFALLVAPPVAFVAAFLTNPLHHLVISDPWLVERAGFVMRSVETRPLFLVFTLYSYLVIAGIAITYGSLLFHGSPVTQKQAALLLVGTIAPWGANVAYMFGLDPDPLLDLTPFGYAAALVTWSWALMRGQMFDLAPIARAAVFDLMKDPVLVVDDHGRAVDANAALLSLLGRSFAEVVGRNRGDLTLAGDGSPELSRAGRTYFVEESKLQAAPGGSIGGRIVVFHDVTDLRAAEVAERTAKEAAEKLALARADFLARTTHEVRTPLYGVLGAAELLLRSPLDPPRRKLVEAVQRSGKSLLEIVDDVLDFAKLDADKTVLVTEDFDAAALLGDLRTLFEGAAARKGIELRVVASRPSEPVRGDGRRTRQILTNLVANAVKFTHEGHVTLTLTVTRDPSPRASFIVEDTGIGIPKDAHDRVLEAFRQGDESTSRRYGGTGLGLSIASQLTTRLGGRLRFTSEVGRGTRFDVELPFEACPALEPAAVNAPRATGERLHVLVVDDHDVARAVTQALLEDAGCVVTSVATGDDAIAAVLGGAFDFVILDLRMPDVDGAEVVRRLRAQGDRTRIVLFSADGGASVRWPSDLPAVTSVLKGDPARLLRLVGVTIRETAAPSNDLLDAFEQSSTFETEALARAIERGDAPEVARLLHGIEGSSRMVGARRTTERCVGLRATASIDEELLLGLENARREDLASLRASVTP